MKTIGERIKEARTKKGLSQTELAEKLGYKSRSSVNKIEVGGRDIPRSQIVKIAEILGVTPSYLMGWEDDDGTSKILQSALDAYAESIKNKNDEILKPFRLLNEEGKDVAIDYVKYLTTIKKYTSTETPEGMEAEGTLILADEEDN